MRHLSGFRRLYTVDHFSLRCLVCIDVHELNELVAGLRWLSCHIDDAYVVPKKKYLLHLLCLNLSFCNNKPSVDMLMQCCMTDYLFFFINVYRIYSTYLIVPNDALFITDLIIANICNLENTCFIWLLTNFHLFNNFQNRTRKKVQYFKIYIFNNFLLFILYYAVYKFIIVINYCLNSRMT